MEDEPGLKVEDLGGRLTSEGPLMEDEPGLKVEDLGGRL